MDVSGRRIHGADGESDGSLDFQNALSVISVHEG